MTHYFIVDAIPHRGSLLFYVGTNQLTNFLGLATLYKGNDLPQDAQFGYVAIPFYITKSSAFWYNSKNKLWTPELIAGMAHLPEKEMTENECCKFFNFTLETICKIEEDPPYKNQYHDIGLGDSISARLPSRVVRVEMLDATVTLVPA